MALSRFLLVGALLVAGVKLAWVQSLQAETLSAQADKQRVTKVDTPAQRGTILDRDGVKLAFSVESRALAVHPKLIRRQWADLTTKGLNEGISVDEHLQQMADYLHQLLGDKDKAADILAALRSDKAFVYLDQQVDPTIADKITQKFSDVETETRAVRLYPNGSVASNVIGLANWRLDQKPPGTHGLAGLESSMDNELAGTPGIAVADTQLGNNSVVIPGTEHDLQQAEPGDDVQLTLDTDLQYYVQQKVAEYVGKVGAKDGSAVVMDARTGEVYALANNTSFDPNNGHLDSKDLGDAAITTPYEPGSVNKVVTAAAAIEAGVVTPQTVISIPSSLKVADRTIHDAWAHGTVNMTFTGVLAKSSNIGTLEVAQKVGPDRFADMLTKMGLGQKTGIGLPGESAGSVPPRSQWSGSTFGNLPIGQGLSMTVLQMAGMYQAIANDGVRVPPRILESLTKPDGTKVVTPRPAGVRVVSAKTAKTVRDMMRAVTQKAPNQQSGTAPSAALPGYQISGKTGTAQQVNSACGCYSDSQYWVTFAGILPADNPRFVVGIMMDAPTPGLEGGTTAAPLFHDIASYMTQRYHIPMSPGPTPIVPLVIH